MSHSKSDTKSELQALQDKCRIELLTNMNLYSLDIRQLKESVNDENQLKQWLGVSALMDVQNLLLHMRACFRRLAVSELNPTTGGKAKKRVTKRMLKQVYIQSLSTTTLDIHGKIPSPAIAQVHLYSEDPQTQGNVV